MRPNTLALALALAFCSLPLSALAQDSGDASGNAQDAPAATEEPAAEEASGPVTWSLALTSDYVFRGITQSDYDPALQAGLTYTWDSTGIYVGGWTSNIDFQDSDGPDIEFDSYVGWSHDLNDEWNVDLSAVYYSYFGEKEAYGNIDYVEFIGKASWKEMLTFTLGYAPDYANSDYSSLYANLSGSWEIGNGFTLNGGIGHTNFSDDVDGYTDWTLGVSRAWGPATFALSYYDTDIDFPSFLEHNHASDQVVLTVSFGN
jgi:uncharacterized protein (TIGR02001 family)